MMSGVALAKGETLEDEKREREGVVVVVVYVGVWY